MRLAAPALLAACTAPVLFAAAFVATPPPLSSPQLYPWCAAGAVESAHEVKGDCRTGVGALAATASGDESGLTRSGLVRAAAAAAAAVAAGVASGASPASATGRESEPEITSKAFIEVSVIWLCGCRL